MPLLQTQRVDGGNLGGQQVEHVRVEAQAEQAGDDGNEQQEPEPATGALAHGRKNPSMTSPVERFSSRQPSVPVGLKRNFSGSFSP